MLLQINDTTVENFVIENNILKGVDEKFANTHNIGEVIFDTLHSKPDHVSQIDAATGRQTTFAEMQEFSVRCGLWLRKQGIGPGDIVTLCTHNHLDTYVPFLATFYVGAVYNAWSHEVTLRPARHLMKLIQPKIIFACENVADIVLEAAKLENVDTKIVVFGKHPSLESLRDVTQQQTDDEVRTFRPRKIKDPREVGFIILSSGSSGLPKGVVHSYGNLVKAIQSFSPSPMKTVALWYSTCYWVTGFIFTFQNILTCGTRIIHTDSDPEEICRVIEKYKIRRLMLSPISMTYFCKSNVFDKYKLESLEYIMTGGSKINVQVLKTFKNKLPNAFVYQAYGMSETGRVIAMQTKTTKNLNSTGFVASCNQLKVIDLQTGRSLGPNESGELCIKSPIMMLGYYKNPEATKEAIDAEGWLHTGDKAYCNENGEVFIVDRLKEVMKYQNRQVSPAEIEEVLLSHSDVIEAAVVPVPHEIDGEHAMAFVKKVQNSKVTEKELVQLSSTLADFKKLRGGVKFLDNLPKTATGKISRPHLKEMAKAQANNNGI